MKKLLFTLFATSLLFAFTGCGSDDDKEQKFFKGDCKQTISLKSGSEGSQITTKPTYATLDDMLKGATGFGSPISTGELLITGENTAAMVKGLPEGVTLKGFKVDINGLVYEFGDISNEAQNLNLYKGTKNAEFFSKAFDKIVSAKSMTTKVTFTPTQEISEDVTLEIVFTGTFSYWAKI